MINIQKNSWTIAPVRSDHCASILALQLAIGIHFDRPCELFENNRTELYKNKYIREINVQIYEKI